MYSINELQKFVKITPGTYFARLILLPYQLLDPILEAVVEKCAQEKYDSKRQGNNHAIKRPESPEIIPLKFPSQYAVLLFGNTVSPRAR